MKLIDAHIGATPFGVFQVPQQQLTHPFAFFRAGDARLAVQLLQTPLGLAHFVAQRRQPGQQLQAGADRRIQARGNLSRMRIVEKAFQPRVALGDES